MWLILLGELYCCATNKIMNEVQTYNRQGVNKKVADIVEGGLYCCAN
jgi:hypothetical protein